MNMAIPFVVSVLPVFLFLGALMLLDSYKLIPMRAILLAVGAGAAAGAVSYAINISLQPALGMDLRRYTILVAPLLEEILKARRVSCSVGIKWASWLTPQPTASQ